MSTSRKSEIRWTGNEGEFNRSWSRELTLCGALVFPIVASAMQQPGWPDRYVAHRRWSGWLEGKVERGAASKIQEIRMCMLLRRGVPAAIIRRDSAKRKVQLESPIRLAANAYAMTWFRCEAEGDGLSILKKLEETREHVVNVWLATPPGEGGS